MLRDKRSGRSRAGERVKRTLAAFSAQYHPAACAAFVAGSANARKSFAAGWTRNQKGDANDTRELVLQLIYPRAKRNCWAQMTLPAGRWPVRWRAPGRGVCLYAANRSGGAGASEQELADIQQVIDQEGGDFARQRGTGSITQKQVRRAKFAIDEAQLKPYFALERVLRDGVFWAATQLFGIRFVERFDIPVYHPDVRVWEIIDASGEGIALLWRLFLAG